MISRKLPLNKNMNVLLRTSLNSNFSKPLLICGYNNYSTRQKNRTTQLKEMINSPKLEYIMEAHSGLSARIVEESGN